MAEKIIWIRSKDAQSTMGHYYMGKVKEEALDLVGEVEMTDAVQIREVQISRGNQVSLDYMVTADHMTTGSPITVFMSEALAICTEPSKALLANYEKAVQSYRASLAGLHLANNGGN